MIGLSIKNHLDQNRIGIVTLLVLTLCFAMLSFSQLFFKETSRFGERISTASKQEAIAPLFKIPLYFEQNEGQTDASVKYLTRGKGYTSYFTPQEMVLVLQGNMQNQNTNLSVLKMRFIGANLNPTIKGIEKTSCISNYFIGNDRNKWHANIANYAKVCYEDLYPGINVEFYGNSEHLEYDICVAPGTNPQQARFQIEGAKELSIDPMGNLRILTSDSLNVEMQKPLIYQMSNGKKTFIDGKFVLLAQNEVGFTLGMYDPSKTLVIDPVLVYSTYFGGANNTLATAAAIDTAGNVYFTGNTNSLTFPATVGAFQPAFAGGLLDAFIAKLAPAGGGTADLLYATYLGGSALDNAQGIAVDASGIAYVTGFTSSNNFPTTVGAFQTANPGNTSAFITKLNPAGGGVADLLYSTYLGGNSLTFGFSIDVSASGNIYVSGQTTSANFPVTAGAFQTIIPAATAGTISIINPAGGGATDLLYSTFLGGNLNNAVRGIVVDNSGIIYTTGETQSLNFPITANAFQTVLGGNLDAFITKLNPAGGGASDLLYSTFLGGSGNDFGNDIDIDASGNVYVTGDTASTNFPTTTNAFQTVLNGTRNAFITKLNPAGGGASDLLYSTYLGGSGSDTGTSIKLDNLGNAYVTGNTSSASFPTTIGAFQTAFGGILDAFVTKLNPIGGGITDLIYSTFLGGAGADSGSGIDVDSSGNAYVAGSTSSANFPVTPGAFQTTNPGATNSFISKLAIGNPTITGIVPNVGPTLGGTIVTITGTNFSNATSVNFDGIPALFIIDNDNQITAVSPPHVAGTINVTVTALGGTSPITPADQFTYQLTESTTVLTASPNPSPFGEPLTLTATVAPEFATGTVSFFDGTTLLGTAPLINGVATLIINNLSIGDHILTAVYSGDLNFSGSTSPPIVVTIAPNIFPPRDAKGKQEVNKFATQADFINVLSWKKPLQGSPPASYRIFVDRNLNKLIAEISSGKLRFKEHNRKKDKTYIYFIVSVDEFGNQSTPVKVKVRG